MSNPYAPPRAPIDGAPPPRAPTGAPSGIPTTLGVLSMIFGGGLFLFSGIGLLVLAAAAAESGHALGAGLAPALIGASLPVWMSLSLLVFGVGLVRRRAWARRATIWWARAALVEVAALLVLFTNEARAGVGFGELIILSPLLLALVAYPVVLLALLSRPSAIAACDG
ncbi:MAG TPA: hypothetical protein VFF06_21425 [Polyangia bacterium]|nr:hypothetical protein [Polyangia bacterium]